MPYLEHPNRVCLSGTLCGIDCVGRGSKNLIYVGFDFRREMTIMITLFPELALGFLVPLYKITRRRVPEVLIFQISILRILCFYMSYDNVFRQHPIFHKRLSSLSANKRTVIFTNVMA